MTYGINNAKISDLTNTVPDYTITAVNLDSSNGTQEYTWQNNRASEFMGYFYGVPELKSAILMKTTWVLGKGFTTDVRTSVILDSITGMGKDTFRSILKNQYAMCRLMGDSFAEIIRDEKGVLINLKPLDPGSMKIVTDEKGIIKRYEQTSKVPGKTPLKFSTQEIFHLCHNRIGDQVHGISDVISMEQTILAELENFTDLKKIMHRQARPMILFKLGTDDPVVIANFQAKMDAAVAKGENIYVPFDDKTFTHEVIQATIGADVMAYRDDIRNKFYRSLGLPLIVFGNGGTTESGGKIEYLAHEQIFSDDQLFVEEQVWQQLYLRIKLNSPVTLLDNLQTDQSKDANQGMEIQPSDVTAGRGA